MNMFRFFRPRQSSTAAASTLESANGHEGNAAAAAAAETATVTRPANANPVLGENMIWNHDNEAVDGNSLGADLLPTTEGTRLLHPRNPAVHGYTGLNSHSSLFSSGGGTATPTNATTTHTIGRMTSFQNQVESHGESSYTSGTVGGVYGSAAAANNTTDINHHQSTTVHQDETQRQPQTQPQQEYDHPEEHDHDVNAQQQPQEEAEQDVQGQIANLTNRLRILFYTLYIPIIPLSVLLVALLLQLLIKAAASPPCSYPLRFFALLSLLLFIYTPNHKIFKRVLFNYSRERDGAIRPRSVRIYDQVFHMICLMYIYLDMVLIQSCREDIVNNESTCTTSCPDLYTWFQRFDIVLRIFLGVLVLPLVCLPFVYIWIMRRIHRTETLRSLLEELERREEGYDEYGSSSSSSSGVKVKDVMEGLRRVKLVQCKEDPSRVRVVGVEKDSWTGDRLRDRDTVKDCCICMCEFECEREHEHDDNDDDEHEHEHEHEHDNHDEKRGGRERMGSIRGGLSSSSPPPSPPPPPPPSSLSSQECIVQTKCGHLFHKACIGGWIGGRNWEDSLTLGTINARARRRCCPLCREDLAVYGSNIV